MALQLLMGVVVIITGSTAVGIVALGSMAACMWVYALAEIVAFYRVGLPEPEPIEIGTTRSNTFNPRQF